MPETEAKARKLQTKRKKVDHACVYCRRSHMTCDAVRPCTRCIKRNIGHLCHDNVKPAAGYGASADSSGARSGAVEYNNSYVDLQGNGAGTSSPDTSGGNLRPSVPLPPRSNGNFGFGASMSFAPDAGMSADYTFDSFAGPNDYHLMGLSPLYEQQQQPSTMDFIQSNFASQYASDEFLVLQDFLNIVDGAATASTTSTAEQTGRRDDVPHTPRIGESASPASSAYPAQYGYSGPLVNQRKAPPQSPRYGNEAGEASGTSAPHPHPNHHHPPPPPPAASSSSAPQPSDAACEKFFLTASNPEEISPEERLKRVIKAKVEAGILRPFNYIKGYARLQNMSSESRQRILLAIDTCRPKFRALVRSLTDVDLIMVEESFERLLLDYDRMFAAMAVPACLWRRTGEIFRGNKQFAQLIGRPVEHLRDGRLSITELMGEESAVNYWEKYSDIAFDPGQKAVLTSCLLKTGSSNSNSYASFCFSFTIRRDKYNIPSCIVGNFIMVDL